MSHKITLLLAGAAGAALLVSGCAPKTLPVDEAEAKSGHPVARVVYACDSITERVVRYPDDHTAIFPYRGETHRLTLAVSASGARYVGDGLVWWTKGSGEDGKAFLYEASNPPGTGEELASCQSIETSREWWSS